MKRDWTRELDFTQQPIYLLQRVDGRWLARMRRADGCVFEGVALTPTAAVIDVRKWWDRSDYPFNAERADAWYDARDYFRALEEANAKPTTGD